MFLFFGTSYKEDEVKRLTNIVCPCCGRYTSAVLVCAYSYFHLFFIPLFRFGRRYMVKLSCCGAVYEATEQQYRDMCGGAAPDFSAMRSAGGANETGGAVYCKNCGRSVDGRYTYCPYCGSRLI